MTFRYFQIKIYFKRSSELMMKRVMYIIRQEVFKLFQYTFIDITNCLNIIPKREITSERNKQKPCILVLKPIHTLNMQ